jgi:hypothetical protein
MKIFMIKNPGRIIFVIGALLFCYTAYRALVMSITWDEAYSYLQYVRNGILFPEKYEQMDANNHLLNTWLNIRFVKYFGVSEFVLRLPALLAHLLFLFFSYKLVREFRDQLFMIIAFLIINLNPYLLDFFSLSRGYGLSLGFMMGSIYFLYCFVNKDRKVLYATLCCSFAALACGANFVALNYFVAVFAIIAIISGFHSYHEKRENRSAYFLGQTGLPFLILIFSMWILLPIAFKLKEAGALFYGGNEGFWKDTFLTITERFFYEAPYADLLLSVGRSIVIIALLIGGYLLLVGFLKKKFNERLFLGALFLLILLFSLSTIVQFHLFGTQYLTDRTALYFIVFFNLILVFILKEFEQKKSVLIIYSIVGIFVVFHFVSSFNLRYVLEWKSNAEIKQMLSDLEEIKEIPAEKSNISICIPLSFDQGINYYRAVHHLNWINPVNRNRKGNLLYDYIYSEPGFEFSLDAVDILKTYPVTNTFLAKPKVPPGFSKVLFSQQLNFEDRPGGSYVLDETVEYSEGFSSTINDSMLNTKEGEVVFNVTALATDISMCNLGVILSFENKQGVYVWKRAFVKDWITKANQWEDISFTELIPNELKKEDVLKAYVWNPNKHRLMIKKMELKWISRD